jgi:serine/threonine protein kinase
MSVVGPLSNVGSRNWSWDTKEIRLAPVDLTSFLDELDSKLNTTTIVGCSNFASLSASGGSISLSSTPSPVKWVNADSIGSDFDFDAFTANAFTPVLPATYEFLEILGSGGMGMVYKARHKMLNKTFAIKMLHQQFASEVALQRFFFEGKAASLLSDPGVVQVHHLDVTSGGQPYMVMDFIEGNTLAEEIREQGALSVERTVSIAVQICMTMSHAHNRSILHRDIKPSNIMLARSEFGTEEVRILDFGIAKLLDDTESGVQQLTRTGDAMGSPIYMSPEQARGCKLDQRADIYSLGCSLYEALAGVPPFVGGTAFETIAMHLHKMPDPIARKEVPAELERIIMRTLAKDPEQRYESMAELLFDLERFQYKQSRERKWGLSREQRPIIARVATWFVLFVSVLTAGLAGAMNIQRPARAAVLNRPTEIFTSLPALDQTGTATIKYWVEKQRVNHWTALALAKVVNTSEAGNEALAPFTEVGQELTSLDLGGDSSQITDAGLIYLSHLHLTKLNLEHSLVAHLHAIARMNSLRDLSLIDTSINEEGLKTISHLPNLVSLNLARTTTFTGADLHILYTCKNLQFIKLNGCKVTPTDLVALQNHLPDCLIDCKKTADESFLYSMPEFIQAQQMEKNDCVAADKLWRSGIVVAKMKSTCSRKSVNAVLYGYSKRADLQVRLGRTASALQILAESSAFARANRCDNVTCAVILEDQARACEVSKSRCDILAAIQFRNSVQDVLEKGVCRDAASKALHRELALNARDRAFDYAFLGDVQQTAKGIKYAVIKLRAIGALKEAANTNFKFSECCRNAHRSVEADLAQGEAESDMNVAKTSAILCSND